MNNRSFVNSILSFLLFQQWNALVLGIEIYGKIQSCHGWALDKKPELKSFIRYGGAISFQNVEIEFQMGKRATLTIYHDGEEYEKVDLQDIETEAEMIQMMIDKEFRWKPQEQVEMIRQVGDETKKREEAERNERMEEAKRKMEAYRRKKAEEKIEKEGEL